MTFRISIWETPNQTISLIKTKSRNALLRMLPVCIGSYLKSILRYTFIILDTCHPDTLCLCEQECEDLWSFFRGQGGPRAKGLGNTALMRSLILSFVIERLSSVCARKREILTMAVRWEEEMSCCVVKVPHYVTRSGRGAMASHIDIKWRTVVSFTSRPLYFQANNRLSTH